MLGWPEYFVPVLMRAGHLRPLGKPSQNSRKWFATVELEHLSRDREWLDKAIRIVEKHVQQMNGKQRSKAEEENICHINAVEMGKTAVVSKNAQMSLAGR